MNKQSTIPKTADVTPEVYESQDVPGNFGFIGCDSDQYPTREAAEQAASQSAQGKQPTGSTDNALSDQIIQSWFSGNYPNEASRLADSAPALLEALKGLLRQAVRLDQSPTKEGLETCDALAKARAAIAAATTQP